MLRRQLLARASPVVYRHRLLLSTSATPESSLPASLNNIITAASPFIPKWMTDHKLDADHKSEKRRLDGFHGLVEHLDRKITAPFPSHLSVDLSSSNVGSSGDNLDLDAESYCTLLHEVREQARARRREAEEKLWGYAGKLELGKLELEDLESEGLQGGGGGVSDGDVSSTGVCVGVGKGVDAEELATACMRLRLLEKCCDALLTVPPPLGATAPASSSSASASASAPAPAVAGSVLAQWQDSWTSLRADHGVLVSLPGLMSRLGLTRSKLKQSFGSSSSSSNSSGSSSNSGTSGSSGGSSNGTDSGGVIPPPPAPSPAAASASSSSISSSSPSSSSSSVAPPLSSSSSPLLLRSCVVQCLKACLEGGYDDRLEAHLNLFAAIRNSATSTTSTSTSTTSDFSTNADTDTTDSLSSTLEKRQPLLVLSWEETETVVKVVAEFSAAALRDELRTFVAVNPAHTTHRTLLAEERKQKKKQLQLQLQLEAQQEGGGGGGGGGGLGKGGGVQDGTAAEAEDAQAANAAAAALEVRAAVARDMKVKAVGNYEPLHGDQGHAVAAAASANTSTTTTNTSSSSSSSSSSTNADASTTPEADKLLTPTHASNLTSSFLLHGLDKASVSGTAASPASPASPPASSGDSSSSSDGSGGGGGDGVVVGQEVVSNFGEEELDEYGQQWAAAWPMEGRAGKSEVKRVGEHAKVWLLHDFDHTQKWRCCFAWAEKEAVPPVPVEKNSKLDFFGTAILDGGVTAEELITAQRTHFKELAGFSQHFSASYKSKRMEEYMTKKGNRETARIGAAFVLGISVLDNLIIER